VCNLCGELIFKREPGGRGMTMRPGGYRAPAQPSYSALVTLGLLGVLVVVVYLIVRFAL
jgi:hypothetical protein